MTEDEHQLLKETHQLAKDTHNFWFKPPVPNTPTRAEEHDTTVSFRKSWALTVRILLWIPGMLITLAGAWKVIETYFAP